MLKMNYILSTVGARMLAYADFVGRMFYFWADIMAKCVTPRFYVAETDRQRIRPQSQTT